MIVGEISSEAHSSKLGILLTLRKEVHVLLAHVNLVGTLLQAVQQGLVKAVAGVLLNLLAISGLSILNWGLLHGGLLHRSLLLLLRSVVA